MPAGLYSCFDFRVRSEIPLPELLVADDPADTRPIVEIDYGTVPERLPGAVRGRGPLTVSGEVALIGIRDTARYLIERGERVTVEPLPGGSERNLRLFLLGSVLGVVAWRRGLLPIHANAIVVDGAAVAFAGPSGAGKSTLAGWFERAGYEVLCDDVCVVRFDPGGQPVAWPGLPRLKLWRDAAGALGHDADRLDRVIEGKDKYSIALSEAGAARPIPLRSLYLLARSEGAAPSVAPLRGPAALRTAIAQSYRRHYPQLLGLETEHLRLCSSLIGRVPMFEARRVWGLDRLHDEAAWLERHVRGG